MGYPSFSNTRDTKLAQLLTDLDRCVHGRHVKDHCITCQKEGHDLNAGNPYLEIGQRIGTTLYGQAIVVPSPDERYEPEAWVKDA